jgi:hypothetical protein
MLGTKPLVGGLYHEHHFKGLRPPRQQKKKQKQGVCHIVLLSFTLKIYLKAKEELGKFKYFTMQKYNLQKKIL